MRLIHRSKVLAHLQATIQQYCLRPKISASTHLEYNPAYVETLLSDAKTWIRNMTGYAILSHRWGPNELTFSDVSQFAKIGYGSEESTAPINSMLIPKNVTNLAKGPEKAPYANFELLEAMKSYCDANLKSLDPMEPYCDNKELYEYESFLKIIRFCTKSREYQCDYVWFDTGCIDRNSSSELEESIRSMFNWYRNSKICIIHLSQTTNGVLLQIDPWFTRGWTLQELLAPPRVKFLDGLWEPLTFPISSDDDDKLDISGSQTKKYLWNNIFRLSKISDELDVVNFEPGVHQVAAGALSWLSQRETTRDEDLAYCLIGILGIPLTIAYGEGMQAFYRLQVEILQRTSDVGLFAWLGLPATANSMFASKPQCFQWSFRVHSLFDHDRSVPISMTGHGLHITLMAYDVKNPEICMTSGRQVELKVDGLENIPVTLRTSDDHDKVELAVLGEIHLSEPKKYLAILLGSKKGRCKRIPTERFISISLPNIQEWSEPKNRYIQ